ncbi:MAG: hypothetical protein P8J65_05920 [Candidatus Actinomarina sp.]|nr:hypothetical protein [Candidatus Actinomarina sp.]
MHEVHVEVDAADGIFVVPAVAIIVDPFCKEIELRSFAFLAIRSGVQPWVITVGHMLSFKWIMDAHHGDDAVAIEIFRPILISGAVSIRIISSHVSIMPSMDRLCQIPFVAIGVDPRDDVERVGFEECDGLLITIGGSLKQSGCDVNSALAGVWPRCVDSGDEQNRRAFIRIDRTGPSESNDVQFAILKTGSDRIQGDITSVYFCKRVQLFLMCCMIGPGSSRFSVGV